MKQEALDMLHIGPRSRLREAFFGLHLTSQSDCIGSVPETREQEEK